MLECFLRQDEVPSPLVRLEKVTKKFSAAVGFFRPQAASVQAVAKVDLAVIRGETLAIVGESGCGKTTLGRLILRLIPVSEGTIEFAGQDITRLSGRKLKDYRRQAQMIFQDPYSSLNPRRKAHQTILEPLVIHGLGKDPESLAFMDHVIDRVGVTREQLNRYPHEFSGGQRQRIGIARALVLKPRLLLLDEPVSSLDVSIQAQILSLLKALQEEFCLTYIFISHDLSVVRYLACRVAVMYLGRIVEEASCEELFQNPRHPYTKILLASVPRLDPGKKQKPLLTGDLPSPFSPPSGCPFHPRCPEVMAGCRQELPERREIKSGHAVSCHRC
jgi:oligopeptide/dipeptide ABC transporter ATP-binding protein